MNTATITSLETETTGRRMTRAILTFLRQSLEFTGRAYLHGARPL